VHPTKVETFDSYDDYNHTGRMNWSRASDGRV